MERNFVPRDGKTVREADMNTAEAVLNTAREFIDTAGQGETVKARLRSAARDLGIPFGVAKRIRYGEIKSLPAHIFATMAERYTAVLERREKQLTQNLARNSQLIQQWRGKREGTDA